MTNAVGRLLCVVALKQGSPGDKARPVDSQCDEAVPGTDPGSRTSPCSGTNPDSGPDPAVVGTAPAGDSISASGASPASGSHPREWPGADGEVLDEELAVACRVMLGCGSPVGECALWNSQHGMMR